MTIFTSKIAKERSRPFSHEVKFDKTTPGDIHLNGKATIRIHPRILKDSDLYQIADRIFEVIDFKGEVAEKYRLEAIEASKKAMNDNLNILSRRMTEDEFDHWYSEEFL